MGFVGVFIFAAAWIGHSALWLVGLNVLYSRPIHRDVLNSIRLVVGLVVFAFPVVIGALLHWGIIEFSAGEPKAPLALEAYLILCLTMALAVIPVVTFVRSVQSKPPHLVSEQNQVINVTEKYGRAPVGDGKRAWMARLPGNQVFQIEFSELTLRLPRLPSAWDGLTLLHLTDLHFTGTPDRSFYEFAIDRCMEFGAPDIIAITGDLVDTERNHRWLLPLLSRLRWNEAAFAIVGNHDYWFRPERIRRRLARLGITVLGNSWRSLTLRGELLTVVGNETPWFKPAPDLSDCRDADFRLCLSHAPDTIRWARRHRIDLMLSGHNHGGQIRLPLFGSLFVPSLYSRKYDCGLFWEDPTLLYVGRGIGGKEPLRYNCRPQITRFVLRRGDSEPQSVHDLTEFS